MTKIVIASLLLTVFCLQANAADKTILLDCNLDTGSDQQVTISQVGSDLILSELTSNGSLVSRKLEISEWQNKKIRLRDDLGSPLWFYKVGSSWMYHSKTIDSYAQCYK